MTLTTPVASVIWVGLFPALLVAVAVLFLAWHVLAWKKVSEMNEIDFVHPKAQDFHLLDEQKLPYYNFLVYLNIHYWKLKENYLIN